MRRKTGSRSNRSALLLDLLVVSIASDIVPWWAKTVSCPFRVERPQPRTVERDLLSIIKICGLDKHNITIDDIVFKIGPRINAAGRMRMDENDENASPSGGHAAIELLIEGQRKHRRGVRERHRRLQPGPQVDRPLGDAGSARLYRGQSRNEKLKSTLIYSPKWMKGIVGIVASRLIETYYRRRWC